MRSIILPGLALSAILAGAVSPALASSDDAWVEFEKDVRAACLKAVGTQAKKPKIAVDPYGTESYGVALVAGSDPHGNQPIAFVCVYDKRSKKAEINQGFGKDQVEVKVP